ncbi:DegV family protein [Cytobacillus sp. S13-E01]|uniref:DegV family protein n=1 Tax=Cytobacillus sp. S13-E01 TaxID=3031326 RepID=UPI0023D86114|nr:DegV family protein [Cytobacillus sp. S13-E01]MDF0725748.1 DegV family protein [Cytobacillus sp. S13-E01]
MVRVAWVTDSTAYLDDRIKERFDVYTIPMTIIFGTEQFQEGVNITLDQFYKKLKSAPIPPKTSQPSVGMFVQLYETLQAEYDHIFSVHVSSKLSGTVFSAFQASELVNIPVTVIDSKILTYPMGVMIREGIRLHEEGNSIEAIGTYLEKMAVRNETYVLIGSLEQLHRSGRMNSAQFYLGSLLKIKPIISLTGGSLTVVEKVRSEKKATARIVEMFEKAYNNNLIKEVYLLYGLRDDKVKLLMEEIRKFAENVEIKICPLGTAIGVHAGEETIGISWFCPTPKEH